VADTTRASPSVRVRSAGPRAARGRRAVTVQGCVRGRCGRRHRSSTSPSARRDRPRSVTAPSATCAVAPGGDDEHDLDSIEARTPGGQGPGDIHRVLAANGDGAMGEGGAIGEAEDDAAAAGAATRKGDLEAAAATRRHRGVVGPALVVDGDGARVLEQGQVRVEPRDLQPLQPPAADAYLHLEEHDGRAFAIDGHPRAGAAHGRVGPRGRRGGSRQAREGEADQDHDEPPPSHRATLRRLAEAPNLSAYRLTGADEPVRRSGGGAEGGRQLAAKRRRRVEPGGLASTQDEGDPPTRRGSGAGRRSAACDQHASGTTARPSAARGGS
jgi:hypothetical protein